MTPSRECMVPFQGMCGPLPGYVWFSARVFEVLYLGKLGLLPG
jgi:hypothetical protein